MKENIRFLLFGAALCFFGFYPVCVRSATITSPESVQAGRLAKIQSDVNGDWLIYPPNGADIEKDSNEKTLYFVARQEGEFTIIFFGVEGGKPVISQKPLIVGDVEPTPSPKPYPEPSIKLSEKEREAAVYALENVLDGIVAKTIRTPQGARSAFKQALNQKGMVCNGRVCSLPQNLVTLTNDWTERADFSTIETVKESFEKFLKEVK